MRRRAGQRLQRADRLRDLACAADRACFDPVGTYANDVATNIPDNDPTGASSRIDVTEGGIVSSVSLGGGHHPHHRGDLVVRLVKDGTTATPVDHEGAGADDLKKTFEVREFNGLDAAGA